MVKSRNTSINGWDNGCDASKAKTFLLVSVNYSMIGQIKSISQKCQIISSAILNMLVFKGDRLGVHENKKTNNPPPLPGNWHVPKKRNYFSWERIIQPLILRRHLFVFRGKKTTPNQHGNGNLAYLYNHHGMGETTFEANANLPTLLPYWVLLHAAEGAIARAKLLQERSWDMGGKNIWMRFHQGSVTSQASSRMDVSRNKGTPKWMVYDGTPY